MGQRTISLTTNQSQPRRRSATVSWWRKDGGSTLTWYQRWEPKVQQHKCHHDLQRNLQPDVWQCHICSFLAYVFSWLIGWSAHQIKRQSLCRIQERHQNTDLSPWKCGTGIHRLSVCAICLSMNCLWRVCLWPISLWPVCLSGAVQQSWCVCESSAVCGWKEEVDAFPHFLYGGDRGAVWWDLE